MADVRAFPNVPLLGQPVEITGWALIVYATCKTCTPPTFVPLIVKQTALGRAADVAICPGCARAMHVAQLGMNPQNQLEFGIEIGEMAPAPTGVTN